MSKRTVIPLCVLFLSFGLCIWLLTGSLDNEPSFRGKKLSQWIREYRIGATPEARREAEDAVRTMGTNALPTLLRWIQQRDSLVREKTFQLVRRLPGNKADLRRAIHNRGLAGYGFHILGSEASSATSVLTRLLENDASAIDFSTDLMVAESAVAALQEIGIPAIPTLAQALTNRHQSVRKAAAQALGQFGRAASNVVPALVGSLSDTNAEMRLFAVRSLGQIGTDENVVVPRLIKILSDGWELNRLAAATALGAFNSRAGSAVPHLEQTLKNPLESDRVRDAVKDALAAISRAENLPNDANKSLESNRR